MFSNRSEVRLSTLGSIYFAELAELAEKTIGQLMAFIRKTAVGTKKSC